MLGICFKYLCRKRVKRMSKILMINLPYSGHTNPTLGLAAELVRRGHFVGYINAPSFREKIEATGAIFIPYDNYSNDLTDQQIKTRCFLAAYNTGLRIGEDYDLILYELFFYLGKTLADTLEKPCIRQFSMFAWNEHVVNTFIRKSPMWYVLGLKAVRKLITRNSSHGIKIKFDEMISEINHNIPSLNIVYTSKEFQIFADEFDERFQFVGPSIGKRISDIHIPFHEMKDIIVYVSMGTVLGKNKDIYQTCIRAFQGEDVSVIMSLGKYIKQESLGSIPSNFYVYESVPQLEVLEKSSLFITHGGMNSVNEAIYFGVPMLVAPIGGDQPTIADRVEELGMGLRIKGNKISPDELKLLINTIIKEEKFRQNVMKQSIYMKQAGGIHKAADLIEAEISARLLIEQEH